jgi:acetylglutamate kinase
MRVYKLGGPALEDPGLLGPLAHEITSAREPAVLVHGGGRHVERLLQRLGIGSEFVQGRRATSPAAMEVVEMVLSGVVNKGIVAGLLGHGVRAAGLSARDGIIRAEPVPELGRGGRPTRVEVGLLKTLLAAGYVPVVSPVSSGPDGAALNVNADEAALALALALDARSLVFFSDVDGVRAGGEAPAAELDAARIAALVADGTISAGMAMKVQAALEASGAGVPEVWVAGKARLQGAFPGTRITTAPAAAAVSFSEEIHE